MEKAGQPAARLAGHERSGRVARFDDTLFAEAQAGALDLGEGADPLHRLLAVQARLLARVAPKTPADPISAALGSGGQRRRQLTGRRSPSANDAAVATAIRNLAADELGVQPAAVHPGLMKDFLERKVPIADHRMLTLIGYFAAAAWEKSRISANEELEAWASRLLLFVEQSALQDGRTQLSWLLTGLGEPSWGLLTRRKSTLRPFARLCRQAGCLQTWPS